jgi:hypothetical protein
LLSTSTGTLAMPLALSRASNRTTWSLQSP